jgi:hypothetical protein
VSFLIFLAGLVVGIVGTLGVGIAILNRPLPERERPIWSVNSGKRTMTTGPESTFDFLQRQLK